MRIGTSNVNIWMPVWEVGGEYEISWRAEKNMEIKVRLVGT